MSETDPTASLLGDDEVMRQIRETRESIAAECDYDMKAIAHHARKAATRLGLEETVRLQARAPGEARPALPDEYWQHLPADGEVMREIRQARQRLLEEANHDLNTLHEQVRERAKEYGGKEVSRPSRPSPPEPDRGQGSDA